MENIFTKNFNKLVKEKGVSCLQLSKILNIPKSTLHDYSIGVKTIKYENIRKLRNYFNISSDELLFSEQSIDMQMKETVLDFKIKQIEAVINS